MASKKTRMHCCEQNKSINKNISFFQYPKDERLAIWVKNCRTENLVGAL